MAPSTGWGPLGRAREAARKSLGELIAQERKRAQLHIHIIRQMEPTASRDRIANVVLGRWTRVASVEGGLTGAMGFLGVPFNLVLFTYMQVAMVVSIAEAYEIALEGAPGEDAVLSVIGEAHGIDDVLRASPRVLGAVARALALRHGLGTVGRLVPMVAAPISAKLNQREMLRTGSEAMRRFGNVVMIG